LEKGPKEGKGELGGILQRKSRGQNCHIFWSAHFSQFPTHFNPPTPPLFLSQIPFENGSSLEMERNEFCQEHFNSI